MDRGILYAPDYVINAGGIINVVLQYQDQADAAEVRARIGEIPGRLNEIWDESERRRLNPAAVADTMAQRLIGRG
jgi:leucine dehydrogenase